MDKALGIAALFVTLSCFYSLAYATGAITGAITGTTTGAITGATTGNITGTTTGAITGATTGNITGATTGAITGATTGGATGTLFVEGKVYCDPCRVQFETRLCTPVDGATVALECRSRENGTIVYAVEGKTDKNGIYSLAAHKEFEEQICEVRTVSSPTDECADHFDFERARILLTHNNGVNALARYANPLGFMKKESTFECEAVLKELFPEETEDQ